MTTALPPTIEIGQVATCASCGATSEPAYQSKARDPEQHRPHRALLLEWRNGGRPETMAAVVLPTECCACGRAKLGRPRDLPEETGQELFARWAAEFERETGFWAPGRRRPGDEDDGITDEDRTARWVAWLKDRNQVNRPPPAPLKPKGQMALF